MFWQEEYQTKRHALRVYSIVTILVLGLSGKVSQNAQAKEIRSHTDFLLRIAVAILFTKGRIHSLYITVEKVRTGLLMNYITVFSGREEDCHPRQAADIAFPRSLPVHLIYSNRLPLAQEAIKPDLQTPLVISAATKSSEICDSLESLGGTHVVLYSE